MVTAAVLHGVGEDLKLHEEVEIAPPGPGEVKVKMVASGVCHSDLSVQNGTIPLPTPIVLGHEGAGIVEEVGKDVRHLKPGDHVVLSWVENCGRCHYCIAGHAHLCDAMMASIFTDARAPHAYMTFHLAGDGTALVSFNHERLVKNTDVALGRLEEFTPETLSTAIDSSIVYGSTSNASRNWLASSPPSVVTFRAATSRCSPPYQTREIFLTAPANASPTSSRKQAWISLENESGN